MIVQCQQCDTRFQLDESRVPATGVRVRCSRCKESFFLPHPDSSQPDVVHGLAEEAAAGESTSPGVTRDLVDASELVADPAQAEFAEAEPGEIAQTSDPAPQADVGPVLGGISEEEDWQFSDEIPEAVCEVASESAEEAEADAAAFGSVADFSSLIEEVAPSEDESPFADAGSVDDLAEAPEAAELAPEHAAPGDAFASDFSDLSADLAGGAVEPQTAPASGDQDLGDPEDWNFFSESASADYQAPPAVAPSVSASQASSVSEQEEFAESLDEESGNVAVGPGSGRAANSPASRLGHAIGWIVTITLAGFGVFHGLYPTGLEKLAPPERVAFGALTVDGLVPRWVENQYQGRILTVRGQLSNPTSQSLVQEQALLIALLDESGAAMAVPPALAAMTLPEEALRELSPERLESTQARAAGALGRTELAPGQSVSFTAIFQQAPLEAKGFALQAGPAWARAKPEPALADEQEGLAASGLTPSNPGR